MPTVTVTYDYVYFAGGPGRTRQPRPPSGPGGFTLIQTSPGGTQSTGNTFIASPQPSAATVGGATYEFAFMDVTGGTPAGQTSFNSNTPPPPVTVDDAPIVVLVVYVPTGGVGNGGGSGASIDSFDETTGQLFDDTFVSVSPNAGGPPTPTTSGNVNGYVDTTNATETITALSPTSPTGVIFDKWVNLYPESVTGITVAGASLTVNEGTSAYELAFYKAPAPPELDPCLALRLQLADLRGDIGDFPSEAAWARAVEAAELALFECEKAHGEIKA